MSERFNKAVALATVAHADAKRKITGLPYLLHPMEVAAVAAGLTADEDVIIAALLHDTVEDAGISPETLENLFGPRVCALVASETENKMRDLPPEQSWILRKETSLSALHESRDPAVRILWLSDKLANIRSVYAGWLTEGDAVFTHFHVKEKSLHAWYYRSVGEELRSLEHTPAWMEYHRLTESVFADVANGRENHYV